VAAQPGGDRLIGRRHALLPVGDHHGHGGLRQGEVRLLTWWELSSERGFRVVEYGRGDNSFGSIFFADVDAGVAWERDDANPAVWCDADRVIPGATDLGSPGAPNGACVP
jgi:hypothetical protein